jgi:hypothetical protein
MEGAMRKVIVTEFMTLDGVIETPHHWSFPFWNDQVAKFKHNELFSSGALLLGRVTYEQFVAAWPSRTDDTGFADKINSLPKHVASRTLDRVEWNAKLLGEPLVEEIGRLKEEPGGWFTEVRTSFKPYSQPTSSISSTCWSTRWSWARASGCSPGASRRVSSSWRPRP